MKTLTKIQKLINAADKAELAVYNFKGDDKKFYDGNVNGEVKPAFAKEFKKLSNAETKAYNDLVAELKVQGIKEDGLNQFDIPETVYSYLVDCIEL